MTLIIILVLLGILLVFVEVFFVPGTTFVGIMGVIFAGAGIYMAYQDNITFGHILLLATLIILTITIVIGAKSGVWSKLSNKDAITGKVNVINNQSIHVGDQGAAMSAIRPIGKARINGENFEVRSFGQYINTGSTVEVVKITGNKITVKLVKEKSQEKPDKE